MALSGTYAFNPNLGELTIGAYARCGIRRTQITSQHMRDALFEANMLQSELQGDGLQTWQVSLETLDLVAGKGTYNLPKTTIYILDVYIRQNGIVPVVGWDNTDTVISEWTNESNSPENWEGTYSPEQAQAVDRVILPLSRSDYAAIANKYQQGFPTSYWWDRTNPSTMKLWPLPPWDIPNGLQYYVQHRPDDAEMGNGTQVDVPYEVYDYFTWNLAERLAFLYAPEKVQLIAARKQDAYMKYLQATTENVPITMNVQMRGYFR